MIRAGQAQANLKAVSLLKPLARGRVERHLSPESVSLIRESNRFTWIPVIHDVEVTEAVHEETGELGLMEWAKDGFLSAMKGPVLGAMFSGVVRLFGVQPAGMFKLAPLAWRAAYRNCGELTVEETPSGGLRATLGNLPLRVAQSRPYMLGVVGVFDAVLELNRYKGKVSLKNLSTKHRRAEFILLS